MPPALVAELEDVAEQLARLCGELGVDDPLDDDEVDNSHSDLDADDEYVEDEASDVGDGRESLVSSLAAATSECEALMELLNDDCEERSSWSSSESDDECEDDSANEDQRDIQLKAGAIRTRERGVGQDRHRDRGAVVRGHDSDKADSVCNGDLVSEFDGFADELEALSSLMAGLHDGSPGSRQGDFDDSESDFDGEDECVGDSASKPQHEPREEDQVESCRAAAKRQPETLKITTVKTAADSAQTDGMTAPRQARATMFQQHRTPSQPKHRIRRRSFGPSLRLRARKRASPREKDSKRTVSVCNSATDEAYWNEFQRKSFARHISRQQLARLRIIEEQAAEKRRVAARFKHSATLSRNQTSDQQVKGVKQEKTSPMPQPGCKLEDRAYLDRFFHSQEPRSSATIGDHDGDKTRGKDAMTRVLCGVYVYGHRLDGVVYMTFASVVQLRERIASRLGVNPIVNLYRERGMGTVATANTSVQPLPDASHRRTGKKKPHPTRLLQRVSSFEQIADGDMLCVTRDAYEDMAILCEWMTQRRQRPSPVGTVSAESNPEEATRSPKTGSRGAQCERAPSNAVPAFRRMVEGDAARSNRSKSGVSPLWDCNGRSIRIGDAAYRVHSAPGISMRSTNASERGHQTGTRK